MIGRRLITIEIGSRVAIPTRVTAPARASTCIIKFTVILIHRRPPPPTTTNHHNHRCHPRALFSLRAFRLAAIRTVVGGQFSISFHRRNRKNKRNFAGMGISWTNARSDPSYAYFSRIRYDRVEIVRIYALAQSKEIALPFFSPKFSARMFIRSRRNATSGRSAKGGGFLLGRCDEYAPDMRSRC